MIQKVPGGGEPDETVPFIIFLTAKEQNPPFGGVTIGFVLCYNFVGIMGGGILPFCPKTRKGVDRAWLPDGRQNRRGTERHMIPVKTQPAGVVRPDPGGAAPLRILWRRRWPLSERISVVIVDDEIISRGYMELSIEPSRVYEVEASLPSADSALEWLEDNSAPDLLILDVMMKSGIDGLSAARVVRDKYPQMKIIIVTSMADTDWIGEARRIGVDAFWFKTYSEISLLEVMDLVMAGETVYPGQMPQVSLGDLPAERLTPRQRTLLRMMVDGLSNREIAEEMGVSPHTVKENVDTLMDKTGIHSRTALAAQASHLNVVVSDSYRIKSGKREKQQESDI